MSDRQIQRHIAEMEEAGLVQRIARTTPGTDKTSNEHDLSGLVRKMKKLKPEFAKAKDRRRRLALNAGRLFEQQRGNLSGNLGGSPAMLEIAKVS